MEKAKHKLKDMPASQAFVERIFSVWTIVIWPEKKNNHICKSSLLSTTSLVNHKHISLPQSNSRPQMEMETLPVNMVQLPLWSPRANGCVMCVGAARSVLCPVRVSNQTMDLLLQAERTPSTQKALISLLGLILHPRSDEREANEY